MGDDQQSKNNNFKQEDTNAQGDVAVIQPSFDDHDGSGKKSSTMHVDQSSATSHLGRHKQNLSEHFQDATTLSKREPSDLKHRRDYSGCASNPAQAHRRIDSVGNSTSVKRGKPHRRIDSSGLDALTAAAFSREELEAASTGRHTWNKHPNLRRSPIETSAPFNHTVHGPAPQPHPTHPQLTAAAAHHRHYSSLSSSGGVPSRPVYYPHPSYPQPPYPHTYHYHHHPGSNGYVRHHGPPPHPPPPPPGGYPVQYARPHGQDHYIKQHTPLQQPSLERPHSDNSTRRTSPTVASIDHKQAAAKPSEAIMGPPAPPQWPRGGSTQGVQTYITGIGAGETTRTLAPGPRSSPGAAGHHRKLSSFSNMVPLMFGPPSQADSIGSGGAHHRSTSSSLSFLGALDTNIKDSADATFLRNLHESTGTPAEHSLHVTTESSDGKHHSAIPVTVSSKLMAGGTSKRVRRKCTVEGCQNRVVQGGLCISHGAKRKLCKYPGCNKHVKKAGLCSTHGPARKRCEVEGCTKVAVQAGRCIAHGAKKKLCSIDQCTKQAILGGMCKKHHDQKQAGENPSCTIIGSKKSRSKGSKKPGHTRGLSIFQEISVDAVGDLLTPDASKQSLEKDTPISEGAISANTQKSPGHHHRSTASQLLVDIV